MTKFHGVVGFVKTEESASPGIFKEIVAERLYIGDIIREVNHLRDNKKINPDLDVNHRVSIVADAYAEASASHIRYVIFQGTKWCVTAFEVKRPRLILSLGGLYNG